MTIQEKLSEPAKEKELGDKVAETPRKLSKEEKERLIREEAGKSQYYDMLGLG